MLIRKENIFRNVSEREAKAYLQQGYMSADEFAEPTEEPVKRGGKNGNGKRA